MRPWELAGTDDPRLDAVLAGLVRACLAIARALEPFLPDAAGRVERQCAGERLPQASPVFRRLG